MFYFLGGVLEQLLVIGSPWASPAHFHKFAASPSGDSNTPSFRNIPYI